MKTVDFSTVLNDTVQLCGLDAEEFSVSTFKQLRDFISGRLRMCWEHDRFPDIIRYENVAVITSNNVNYCVKPALAGDILAVWDRNPLVGTRAKSITFSIQVTDSEDRLVLLNSYANGVYVEYRTIPPVLTGTLWNTTQTYQVGSQAYFDSGSNSGILQPTEGKPFNANFYKCLTVNTNELPETHPTIWEKIKIPYIFAQYLARGAFADYLRAESQFENAIIAEKEAESLLDAEIDKVIRQQGQLPKYSFIKSY
jgi:hypothetical protein